MRNLHPHHLHLLHHHQFLLIHQVNRRYCYLSNWLFFVFNFLFVFWILKQKCYHSFFIFNWNWLDFNLVSHDATKIIWFSSMVIFKSLFNSWLIYIIIFEIHGIFLNFLNILFIYECEVSEIKISEVIFNLFSTMVWICVNLWDFELSF